MRRASFLVATAAVVGLLLGACSGARGGGTGSTGAPSSAGTSGGTAGGPELAVRVRYTGGLPGPAFWGPQPPLVSVYADGRVVTEGPTPAIAPGLALPNLLVQHLSTAQVRTLTDHGMAAGVADSGDLGRPSIADALTTVFTVVTPSGTHVREVYALGASGPSGSGGLTPEQVNARARLRQFFDELTGLAQRAGPDEPYRATAVAVLARPAPAGGQQPEVAWPGPGLPGQPVPAVPGETCVTATGERARAVLDAAGQANQDTRWRTADGALWNLRFRPLLPDESGCGDVTG